jgi:hypothetical protein
MAMFTDGRQPPTVMATLDSGGTVVVRAVSKKRHVPEYDKLKYLGKGVYHSIDGREFGFPSGKFHFWGTP